MIRQAYSNDIDILNQLIKEVDSNKVTEHDLNENPFCKYIVYESSGQVIGFISYAIMYERSELNYIVVSEKYRNQGIATKLMEYMINDCTSHLCENITLEVKDGNNSAIKLYKKYGFKKISIRKNYYGNCDGIMMERMLVRK